MSDPKHSHLYTSSDEPLYRMMSLSLGSCQGYNYETIMIQEALATTTQPRDEKKTSSEQILKLQFGTILFFTGIIIILGIIIPPQPEVANIQSKVAPTSQQK